MKNTTHKRLSEAVAWNHLQMDLGYAKQVGYMLIVVDPYG